MLVAPAGLFNGRTSASFVAAGLKLASPLTDVHWNSSTPTPPLYETARRAVCPGSGIQLLSNRSVAAPAAVPTSEMDGVRRNVLYVPGSCARSSHSSGSATATTPEARVNCE